MILKICLLVCFSWVTLADDLKAPPTTIKMYSVEKLTSSRLLGEGPHWDHERQHLYYVDAFNSRIHRYIPAEGRDTSCKLDKSASVSIVIPLKGSPDKFLTSIQKDLAIVTWDGESATPKDIKIIATTDQEEGKENNRLNDGKVDPTGRLWVGSMGFHDAAGVWEENRGSLYSFPGGEKVKHFSGITIANGLAWSKDLTKMYYIDTYTKKVDVLDFDSVNGTVSNRRTLIDLKGFVRYPDSGPDGMTIDTDDNLWVAVFGEACVLNIDTSLGKIIRKVELPSKQITSVAFGGPNLDELYVVSANFKLSAEDLKKYPQSGSTFRVTDLGVKGYPGMPAEF